MSLQQEQTEWYYVGQYGELGPLSLSQMQDLIQDRVIDADTYVWRHGMTDWLQAGSISELRSRIVTEMRTPPPAPRQNRAMPQPPGGYQQPISQPMPPMQAGAYYDQSQAMRDQAHALRMQSQAVRAQVHGVNWSQLEQNLPKSDKSRVTAGLLNFIPGVGRFYLGYSAHGVLQLITFVFCGVGIIWSFFDAIYILMGGVKYDGYGRVLQD